MAEKKPTAFTSSTLRAVAAHAAREHQQRREIFATMVLKPEKQAKPTAKPSKGEAR
jgi:hypothetical protein